MQPERRKNQFSEIFGRFLGIFSLIVLFAIAELAPQTNAEENNPLIGKWTGRSQNSVIEHVVRLENDHSFTWDSAGHLVMSGTWSETLGHLDLKFGPEESDTLHYAATLQGNHLSLGLDSTSYSLTKQAH